MLVGSIFRMVCLQVAMLCIVVCWFSQHAVVCDSDGTDLVSKCQHDSWLTRVLLAAKDKSMHTTRHSLHTTQDAFACAWI